MAASQRQAQDYSWFRPAADQLAATRETGSQCQP